MSIIVGPATDEALRRRRIIAAGQNERAAEHQRLKTAFEKAVDRFRAGGREDERKAMLAALEALDAFERDTAA